MLVDGSSPVPLKRRRHSNIHPMELESAKAKLAAAKEKYGREIRVFETFGLSASPSAISNAETDDFYEFTAEDYSRLLATKKQENFLKTRKIREAEEAARRSKITKAAIRVRFPDGHTLEATFHQSETIQNLVDLLVKVVARPDLPFHLYTTPPKKLIKDLSQDFYAAGFIPGAIVYFSYGPPKDDDAAAVNSGPFLQEDVLSLKGLEIVNEQPEPIQSAPESVAVPPPVVQEQKPAEKKPVKPKWLKM
ncbi:plant UBX domain-containing protein 1-like isoform X2 [Mangifera indica]|uniref:plant UBX domain-containing protein 1-like isoform X2 n=1 Tax=Mangifera indica TaxID=29780 RepID=UPI001CFAE110|nr:plant UBX domain-containing protein 1-like isoform X2 [Mangifera indica]